MNALPVSQNVANRQHPCLPSKKGRWIDGKTQTVALLLSACDASAFFICQTFCRQDGGIVPPSLASHQPFQNRTIPLAFRRASVCVCLYGLGFALSHWSFRRASVCVCLVGFASLQSPWAHTLKASLPCLPLPKHHSNYQNQLKRISM